jgi:tetratricopeptide (TPR) repeat protein
MNDWHSFGGVWPESDPNLWPYAISLDLNGNDDYQVRNRSNNSETHSFGHGIHLDMEWKGGDVIGAVEPMANQYTDFHGDSFEAIPTLLEDMHRPRMFTRFQTVGRLVGLGRDAVRSLCNRLLHASDRQLNRDLLECLHYWFVQGKIGDKELANVVTLLKAHDPEVRFIIADDLGLWKMTGAEDALIEVARTDSNAQVRRFALRSLLRLESAKALPVAWRLAGSDTSEDVRRMAVNLIGKVSPSGEVLRLLLDVLEKDRASSVRCAAADAIANVGSPDGVEALREAAKTKDVYLQRACGRALCALYQVEGIELLIGSMSFPSIDAFYNYDRNVPNYVSAFAGFDLPDSERYVQAKWQAWYDAHRDSINIKANADALKAWTVLTDSLRGEPDSGQIPRYEGFLQRFPKHVRARTELAGKLNGLAWNMATAARAAKKGWSLASRAVTYALRAVELSDDPNIWDTLIEAYLAGGKKKEALQACRDALARHPDNQMLKDRLRQLERK